MKFNRENYMGKREKFLTKCEAWLISEKKCESVVSDLLAHTLNNFENDSLVKEVKIKMVKELVKIKGL